MRGVLQQTSVVIMTATTTFLISHEAFGQTSTEKLSFPSAATTSSAETSTAVTPATDSQPAPVMLAPESQLKASALKNYKFEDTSGITDLRMKAEQGSLSRYSAKFSFGYQGPVVDDLSNPYQPDPDASITHNPTSLRGNISLRYRFSPESTMNFGTGVSRVTPFTEDARTDVSTPFVSYDHAHRIHAYQIRESVEAALVTNPEMKNVGQVASLRGNFSVMRNINYSRWEAGIDTDFGTGIYSRPYDPGPPSGVVRTQGRGGRSRGGIGSRQNFGDGNASAFTFGVSPTVRFRISDKVGSYTSLHMSFSEPRSAQGQLQIANKTLSQKAGVDVAITRAIYFSPYLSFYPQTLSLSTTSINFSTIFSLM